MQSYNLRYLQVKKTNEEENFENRVWIPDKQLGYRLCNVLDEGLNDVLVGFRDEQGFFEKKRVERKGCESPSQNTLSEDLCCLTEPNNATVLDSLSKRYQQGVIHTWSGLFCVVVNPWKNIPIYDVELMDEYKCSVGALPPHVYSVAREAFDGIRRGGRNQSILITGESGAGKTENTKKIIDFILHCCGGDGGHSIGADVVNTGKLLEAFGNAMTVHNNNSSRFGKFIKIDFDEYARIQSSQIDCYLLEKSRVVNQNENDRNYHIFYQLFSTAIPDKMRNALNLAKTPDDYNYLNQGKVKEPNDLDDAFGAKETLDSMTRLGFSSDEQLSILEIVAGCLMIGEIKFGERSGMDVSFVEGQEEVDRVAKQLKLKSNRIVDALTSPTIKIGERVIRKNQNLKKTVQSAAAMAKVLYERLFAYLREKCNAVIEEKMNKEQSSSKTHFIGVLDIAGFEILQKNSFEQFCINFTNEKLQQFFNHFMFIKEQAEYEEEQIEWTHINYALDLQPTIDLMEKPLGMFALLEEECLMPNGSDTSMLEKFVQKLSPSDVFAKAKHSKKLVQTAHFSVSHYAGKVDYNVDAWIEKNRDVVENSVLALLSESAHPLISKMFPPVSIDLTKHRRSTIAQATVTFRYRNQLQSLLETLNLSSAHFIRCVVPNYERAPGQINGPLVLHQLRCNGVLEGIRICRKGYPSRMPFTEFLARYSVLGGTGVVFRGREGCERLLSIIDLSKDRYQVGTKKVFCKVGVISELEQKRREFLSEFITQLQAHIRAYVAIKGCRLRVLKNRATAIIQHNIRQFCGVADWEWYRIFSLVRPLIPRDREKQRIEELETAVRNLECSNEDAEKENARLKKRLSSLEREHLDELDRMKKETAEMERSLKRTFKEHTDSLDEQLYQSQQESMRLNKRHMEQIEEMTKKFTSRIRELEDEAQENERRFGKEIRQELEDCKSRVSDLQKEIDAERLKFEKERNILQGEALDNELKVKELVKQVESIKADKEREIQRLKDEMDQNEDVFELMEKKYNEQNQKFVKLNDALREYERQMDEANMSKQDLEKELKRTLEALDREKSTREILSSEHNECSATILALEAKVQNLLEENSKLKLELARIDEEKEDERARNDRQNNTISDLQRLVQELNEKITKFDHVMLEEKNLRRKMQKDKDKLDDDYKHLGDRHDKLKKKYEALKDELRQKDNSIKILERKLEDKEEMMKDCVKDLKESHKARISELEEKIDTVTRKNSKLESENNMQKIKLETTFERESSVDSDYGRSTCSRPSTLGRQYSLTSVSSFSSIRNFRRRETEPDISSSMYLPRRRDSIDMSMSTCTLPRSSSSANLEKDRRISELERQVQTQGTDLNLARRELEVYKTTVASLETEKERLSHQVRTQKAELDELRRQLERSEGSSDSLALRLKRSQDEAEQWKSKHEELIQETKDQILDERRKAHDRMDSANEEQKFRQSRIQQLEQIREELQSELTRCQSDLDRAVATIHELEQSLQSQGSLDNTMEHSLKMLTVDLEAAREENAILKSRLRRQAKQIELLTQQDSTNDIVNHMESKFGY